MSPSIPFPAVLLPEVTVDQMREIDRVMVEDLGITLLQMMEQAGRGLAELAISRYRPSSCIVLAGPGGNGGGGLVAARHLANRGVDVHVVVANDAHAGDATRHQLRTLERMGIRLAAVPEPADLVVDALLGYSLRGDPRGHAAELIRWTSSQDAPVLSLDTPSGLELSTGRVGDPCVVADATLTIALPKTGLRSALHVVGGLFAIDISVPPAAIAALGIDVRAPFAAGQLVRVATGHDADSVTEGSRH